MHAISAALPALFICANLLATGVHAQSNVQIVKQWKLFTYNFPPNAPVQNTSFYNPLNVVSTCITVTAKRIFIGTPRLFSGVPATLSYAPLEDFNESPVLQAYPSWSFSTSWRTNFNCNDSILVSVYRMRVDSCNRLWVLDAGRSRSFEDNEATCPPKILVIDLNTNQIVRRIDIPADVLRQQSLLTSLVIDETSSKSGTCDDVFVYISDTVKPALVVYDSEHDRIWRLVHPAMYPDPDFTQMQILNDRFTIMDGIIGLAFDTISNILYFQPLATDRIYAISRDALRAGPLAPHQILPVHLVGKKTSPGLALLVAPNDGSLIFSPLRETVLTTWNPYNGKQSVLFFDPQRLQFVADISTSRTETGVIYALSSRFHRFLLKNVNGSEFNIRLLRVQFPAAAEHRQLVASLTHDAPNFWDMKQYQLYVLNTHNNGLTSTTPVSYFTDGALVPTAHTKLPLVEAAPMRHSLPVTHHSAIFSAHRNYGEHSGDFVPLTWA